MCLQGYTRDGSGPVNVKQTTDYPCKSYARRSTVASEVRLRVSVCLQTLGGTLEAALSTRRWKIWLSRWSTSPITRDYERLREITRDYENQQDDMSQSTHALAAVLTDQTAFASAVLEPRTVKEMWSASSGRCRPDEEECQAVDG